MIEENLKNYINIKDFPINDVQWKKNVRDEYDRNGILSLENFITKESVDELQNESMSKLKHAYFNPQQHNVYLKPLDNYLPLNHPRNTNVQSSKGCITDDLVSQNSPLRKIYNSLNFIDFISFITRKKQLFPYADKLSSINIHFAREGEELGWHFDNSSFAITVMINDVSSGGIFEYTKPIRGPQISKNIEFKNVSEVLEGKFETSKISMKPGGLLLFNGKNSMHRVTKVKCKETRILAVLAYNDKPGVSLSSSAQMTFYGKTDQ
jgi:predicted 2-oxoglutarate/Fe(II)-dependent dioxygenase YbiX